MSKILVNQIEKNKRSQKYEVLRELGDCYTSVGNCGQAQHCYEKAASLGPDEPEPYVGLGVAAIQRGSLNDADVAFGVACRLDPKCARAYAGRALVAQQRRDLPHALDLYVESLDLDNDNVTALLGLFQVSCEMNAFDRPIRYLEAYLQSHPGEIPVMFALAVSYLKAGRSEQCKTTLLNLLALDPDNVDAANLLRVGRNSCVR
jgi:Flp pilus assembly protein TadD